jgi:hypothetical protein
LTTLRKYQSIPQRPNTTRKSTNDGVDNLRCNSLDKGRGTENRKETSANVKEGSIFSDAEKWRQKKTETDRQTEASLSLSPNTSKLNSRLKRFKILKRHDTHCSSDREEINKLKNPHLEGTRLGVLLQVRWREMQMRDESEAQELWRTLQEIFSFSSSSPSSSSLSLSNSSHRFLASTPAWSDFLVVAILSLLLFLLLWYLVKRVTIQWKHTMEARLEVAKSKRRDRGDKFRDENGYSWDVVFVFKVYEEKTRLTSEQCKWSLKRVMKELADGGLQTRLFYSCQADEVYCKVRVPPARLKKEADRVNMRCKLDPVQLKALCKTGRVVDGKVLSASAPAACLTLPSL